MFALHTILPSILTDSEVNVFLSYIVLFSRIGKGPLSGALHLNTCIHIWISQLLPMSLN